MSGELTSSTPIAVRFFSPPEMPGIMWLPMSVSAHLLNPSAWMMFSTSCVRSASVTDTGNRRAAENVRASRGVCVANSASSCIT